MVDQNSSTVTLFVSGIKNLDIRLLWKGEVIVFAFGYYRELDDQLQDALYQFLEERGISDELAVFLHQYMKNKGKGEYVRWMESVKSYVEQK